MYGRFVITSQIGVVLHFDSIMEFTNQSVKLPPADMVIWKDDQIIGHNINKVWNGVTEEGKDIIFLLYKDELTLRGWKRGSLSEKGIVS